MADGDVVMFINSDDYFVPGRVAAGVRALAGTADKRAAWGFSAVAFIDETGAHTDAAEHGFPAFRDYMYHVAMGGWAAELLPWHNIVLTSGNLIVGADLLASVGAFSDLRLTHDWDMALRLLAVADPVVLPEALYLYRFHGTNTFRTLDDRVAQLESARVQAAWAAAVQAEPFSSVSRLPFVSHLRRQRGLRAAWDGA